MAEACLKTFAKQADRSQQDDIHGKPRMHRDRIARRQTSVAGKCKTSDTGKR
ncbi:hypothetical protein BTHE68_72020 (plasmid) [Burkholderia sp. THE68]|nr:hypothetical protein BTHE68_72020 [Burkholderia sp. THE68]